MHVPLLKEILTSVAERFEPDPTKPKWEYVTAFFGWFAALMFLGILVAMIVRWFTDIGDVMEYLVWAVLFSLGIALSRDWKRRSAIDQAQKKPGPPR